MTRAVVLGLALLAGCINHDWPPVDFDAVTRGGVPVATEGWRVDYAAVDRVVAEYEACSGASVPNFTLGISPDVVVSPCSGQQLFDGRWCHLPARDPGDPCPWRCAGVTWWDWDVPHVVVTPDLSALAHELVHVQRGDGSHDDWRFEACEGIRP